MLNQVLAIKKVLNDLNELISNIKKRKTTRKSTIKKIRNIVSDLDQQRQKESTVFKIKWFILPTIYLIHLE